MRHFAIITVLLLLFACETKFETVYTDVEALSASDLYRADSVYSYMRRYDDQNKKLASEYKEKAKKEKNNPEKAIYYIKRSLSLYPDLEGYKDLAKLLTDLKRYSELERVYYITNSKHYIEVGNQKREDIFLFGEPDKDMVYEGVFTSLLSRGQITGEDVYWAEESGLNRDELKERFLKDERFKMDKNSPQYKNMMLQFLPYDHLDSIAKLPEYFHNYLASIPDTSERFVIDAEKVADFNYENFNGMNDPMGFDIQQNAISEFYLQERQDDKNKWLRFNVNYYFKTPLGIHAVVYAIDTSATACPTEMRHIYHRLITYTANGKIIDSKIIALQSGEDLKTTKRVSTGIFESIIYKRKWKNPYSKLDFDNRVTETKPIGTEWFEISLVDGKISTGSSENLQ